MRAKWHVVGRGRQDFALASIGVDEGLVAGLRMMPHECGASQALGDPLPTILIDAVGRGTDGTTAVWAANFSAALPPCAMAWVNGSNGDR